MERLMMENFKFPAINYAVILKLSDYVEFHSGETL